MAMRQVKILLTPEGTIQVKQLRVPVFLSTFLLLITCISLLSLIVYEYKSMKSQKSRLAQSIEKDEQQERTSLRATDRSPDLNQ
ncbi:hypothetical protein ACFLZT_07310, partial [Thermodesulfobacteriota bacterium]